jgi:hypothetical protein
MIDFVTTRWRALGMRKMATAVLAATTLLTLAGSAAGEPDRFSFEYYEWFVPNAQKAAQAQRFVDTHFPICSDLDSALKDLIEAGAECRRVDGARVYYGCYYSRLLLPLVTSDWRVIIYPDQTGTRVMRISVRRYLESILWAF